MFSYHECILRPDQQVGSSMSNVPGIRRSRRWRRFCKWYVLRFRVHITNWLTIWVFRLIWTCSRSCGVSHSRSTYYRSESNSCASFTMIIVWWAIGWLYKKKVCEAGSSSVQGKLAMRLRGSGMTSKRSTAWEVLPERQRNTRHFNSDDSVRRYVSTDTSCG